MSSLAGEIDPSASQPSDPAHQLPAQGGPPDLNIFVDASTSWGIGISFDGKWDAWRLQPGPRRDITWLESIALEFAIHILEGQGFSDTHVTIHSDSKGAIEAFDKGCCKNYEINLSIRRSSAILASNKIRLDLVHVESVANPADPISRGILGSSESRLRTSFNMPDEIKSIFFHV